MKLRKMVNDNVSASSVKYVLGLGFWVQGFRCFPWMAINFFLKDSLNLPSSTIQLLQNSANLPMVGKPLYGLVSDVLYIRGQHRLPYVAIGALLQAISWLAIAILPEIPIFTLTFLLLLSNLGASIAEVANDAIVAESGKQTKNSSSSPSLQSFAWITGSSGGILGNLLGGFIISHLSPKIMFLSFGSILLFQFLITLSVHESSLNLPKKSSSSSNSSSIKKQIKEISLALQQKEISRSIAWFSASYAVVPVLLGTMFFYQTQHLKLSSSVIGLSKVFGQMAILTWSVVYNKWFRKTSVRKLLSALQVTIAIFMISDVFFVKGVYREMGVSDSVYTVVFSGLLEVLFIFKFLPFSVLLAKLCPSGCEGSVMAFLMSATSLAMMVSGYLGVALAGYVGVSDGNFSRLWIAIIAQAFCTLLPLLWVSCIPHDDKRFEKKEE